MTQGNAGEGGAAVDQAGYGEIEYGDYPTESNPSYSPPEPEPAEPEPAKSSSAVNWPTVLASAGVAAVVSALILSIGVVGLLVADGRDGKDTTAATPTVVNLGAAAQPNQALAPGAPAPAATPGAPAAAPAPAVPAEQVPEAGAPGGPAGGAAAPAQQAPAQQAPAQQAPAPAALTPGQLTTKVKLAMNPGAARSARASELQSGERALTTVDAVSRLLASYPNSGFSYQIIGPVSASGTTMNATLQMSVVGMGTRTRPMAWVWMDDKWKLTDQSVCTIAAYAMIPCSVG